MITRALLWIATTCIRLATRNIETTEPLPWTAREHARFSEGFRVGRLEGYRVGHDDAICDMYEGRLFSTDSKPKTAVN